MPQPVKLKAMVAEVVEHQPGLRTLVLKPERPAPRFAAGQFLHLAIDSYDPASHWPDSRIFSIASSPDTRSAIHVTFSAVGQFTRRMLSLNVGDSVWLKLPYGEFTVETSDAAPAVLVGGGTGVTPFVPLLSGTTPPQGPVWVLYGGRSPEHLIYRDTIERATKTWPHVRATYFAEQGQAPNTVTGQLSVYELLHAAQALNAANRAVFYLSGPPGMLQHFSKELQAHGVVLPRIHIDAWGD